MTLELPKDKWSGKVQEVVLGATPDDGGTRSKTISVGGEATMPYIHFEAEMPHRPVLALEIRDSKPTDWSDLLLEYWGDTAEDPAKWAKAAEEAGADMLVMYLNLTDPEGNPTTTGQAEAATKAVLQASGLPLAVLGPGQADIDNELLVAVANASQGERIALGLCEDKNYRTIAATAMANGHVVIGRAPMDVNLSKQLNILLKDTGLPFDRILMDPTTGALGYGIEYGFSVMERLRLAALRGDAMTQSPMIVCVGYETWKTKESKVGEDIPKTWGDWLERAITWETVTALALIETGADIIVLRHPESLKRVRAVIDSLVQVPELA
ncbi:acetyl-CoA decarbonylase/synthase complex subunit delta [bacterium]|nr:acetyl-CoA decarbonylase/synthase complex subunit delta [bacterium]